MRLGKFFTGWLLTGLLWGDPEVLNQKLVHDEGCGPCAIVNQLQFGTEAERAVFGKLRGESAADKAKWIIRRYGGRESKGYRDGKPIFRKEGLGWEDMMFLTNWVRRDFQLSELEGRYLDRGKDEKLEVHLRRVHGLLKGSLDAGVKPIVSYRSFVAKFYEENEKWLWEGIMGHFVVVTEVQEEIEEGEKGFRFRYADSGTGKVETGYANISEARNFTAIKGNGQEWDWAPNRPFLVVTAPSLRLRVQEQNWYARTFITLNHAVFLEPEKE